MYGSEKDENSMRLTA